MKSLLLVRAVPDALSTFWKEYSPLLLLFSSRLKVILADSKVCLLVNPQPDELLTAGYLAGALQCHLEGYDMNQHTRDEYHCSTLWEKLTTQTAADTAVMVCEYNFLFTFSAFIGNKLGCQWGYQETYPCEALMIDLERKEQSVVSVMRTGEASVV